MSKPETPMIYRTYAQSEGVTVTAETKNAVTIEKAKSDVLKHVIPEHLHGQLKSFVTLPVATEEGWLYGHVNFCPRCGRRLEYVEDNFYYGDCTECDAHIEVTINVES